MMETIYNDFTTKLIPKIQEGLVISKDYFTDLFGRYIKFLFIVDVLSAVLFFVGAIILFFVFNRIFKKLKNGDLDFDDDMWLIPMFIFGGGALFTFIGFGISSTINAIKDVYVPEIRVIEKIQSFRGNGN